DLIIKLLKSDDDVRYGFTFSDENFHALFQMISLFAPAEIFMLCQRYQDFEKDFFESASTPSYGMDRPTALGGFPLERIILELTRVKRNRPNR
ncbi:MAG: hypothetical protein AAFU60_15965, partial [Bacteroidota bacterium]